MNNKIITLLIIKPLIILALIVGLKPSAEPQNSNQNIKLTEEVQAMRGYFLEDNAMKIIFFHKRVQNLKTALIDTRDSLTEEIKDDFVTMVKNFNKAISEFEKLEEYKSNKWNDHRQKFISLMQKVEKQQFALHKELGSIKTTVSI